MRDPDDDGSDWRPVDWVRYAMGVLSRASDTTGATWTPSGDPSRWSGRDSFRVTGSGAINNSQQLIRVQGMDKYARNFQAIGNLALPQEIWDFSDTDLKIWLEVTMGAGQNSILQNFNLRAVVELADPWYLDANNGSQVVKPFVIAGGFIGNSVAARVRLQLATVLGVRVDCGAELMIAPFNAGFGI